MRLKVCLSLAALLLMSVVMLGSAAAQTTGDAAPMKLGNYVATGDFEVGYRFNSEKGDQIPCLFGSPNRGANGECPDESMYDTLVNIHTGGRLLEQTLSLRAPNHNGGVFDDLYVSSFGWGGDPNNVARVRASKHKWYNFNATYRRDQNFFDYNLLANPLNPAGSPFTVPYSPHEMSLAHRMTDVDLTLTPESMFSVRLGYSRNRSEGPAFSTIHEGEESELMQDVSTTTDNYRIGLDYKPLKHTKISYDEILQWYRGDTTAQDQSLYFVLPNGTMTDLGIDFTPPLPSPLTSCLQTTAAGAVVPVNTAACTKTLNGSSQTTSYSRSNRIRTHTPTEQLSLESYNKKWDATGRASYSGNDMAAYYNEFFTGVTRGALDQLLVGPQNGKNIQSSADFAVTYHFTDKFRVSDTFHFMNWRMPSFFDSNLVSFSPPTTGAAVPAGCTNATCVLFPFSSMAQTSAPALYADYLHENSKWNLLQADYDFNRMFGVHAGYRYDHAAIVESQVDQNPITLAFTAPGAPNSQTIISTDTGLVGFWVRPNDKWRANADLNIGTANNWEYRTDPRRTMDYNGRLVYTPTRWATLNASMNAQEERNRGNGCDAKGAIPTAPCTGALTTGEVDFNAHNRGVSLGATLMPNEKFGFDLAYNYSNIASNSFLCYDITTPGYAPPVANCVDNASGSNASLTGAPYETYEIYTNRVHYADASFIWKPITRVTANMGYSIVSSQGSATNFNPLEPLGSLESNFHRPIFAVEYKVAKNWAAKAGWNYYDYNEKDVTGPTLPRNFHDNLTTLSVKYLF